MDCELKCNRLTCRKNLTDKAVVTTCSHIFCVECANELFTAARSCPACDTTLTEPDDVVLCSLHPSNDYKTSVLSGLSPSVILEICSRAIAFWQYQTHQENSFQQAVVKNVTEKNAQAQKQLENVVREANSEISLLNGKIGDLERELETDKRKVRDLVEATKEKDKEYHRLKAQHDKLRRKAMSAPSSNQPTLEGVPFIPPSSTPGSDPQSQRIRSFAPISTNNPSHSHVDIQAVAGGMEANGIHRTPIINRRIASSPAASNFPLGNNNEWIQKQPPQAQSRPPNQRHSFAIPSALPRQTDKRSFRMTGNRTDTDESASEVENLLVPLQKTAVSHSRRGSKTVWTAGVPQSRDRPFAQNRFRPR